MGNLRPLPNKTTENQFIVVIKHWHKKLPRAVPSSKSTASQVASIFYEHCIARYVIPAFLLTGSLLQFVSNSLETLCTFPMVTHLTETAYHLQANGQGEHYKKTIFALLHYYVAEQKCDWDSLVQALTHAYNIKVHCTKGRTLFSLLLSHPPRSTTFVTPTALLTDANSENPLKALRL